MADGTDGPGRRRWWVVPALVAVALVGTGCDTRLDGFDNSDGGPRPVMLVVSEAWVADHQDDSGGGGAAGGTDVNARISSLQQGIDRLREETGTGWTGRQDDVTGYLSELSGGSWSGVPTAFMDSYGPALFGVDSSVLRLGDPDGQTVPGIVTTKAAQTVGEVPVLDASVVFVERDSRVTGVRGRVFPGLTVSTSPTLTAKEARAVAEQASDGVAQAPPSLIVLPRGTGVLAWLVTVAAKSDGTTPLAGADYYLDAATGDILSVQPIAAEGRVALPWVGTGPGKLVGVVFVRHASIGELHEASSRPGDRLDTDLGVVSFEKSWILQDIGTRAGGESGNRAPEQSHQQDT